MCLVRSIGNYTVQFNQVVFTCSSLDWPRIPKDPMKFDRYKKFCSDRSLTRLHEYMRGKLPMCLDDMAVVYPLWVSQQLRQIYDGAKHWKSFNYQTFFDLFEYLRRITRNPVSSQDIVAANEHQRTVFRATQLLLYYGHREQSWLEQYRCLGEADPNNPYTDAVASMHYDVSFQRFRSTWRSYLAA